MLCFAGTGLGAARFIALLIVWLQVCSQAEKSPPVTCVETKLGETIKLRNGVLMPRIGFGTAAMRGESTENAVEAALATGFRHFDGAESKEWYDDAALGRALKKSGIAREELFITTKINPRNYGLKNTKIAISSSLADLQTNYIDLLLLHFPECWSGIPSCNGENVVIEGGWLDAWKVLEDAYKIGTIRAIGLSNFHYELLRDALSKVDIKPHVVQNWMDPFHQDKAVRDLCKQEQIAYTAYSSLGGQWGLAKNPVIHNNVISSIAKRNDMSNIDVVLRWSLAKNVIILPRSNNPNHIRANSELIKLLKEAGDGSSSDEACIAEPKSSQKSLGLSLSDIELLDNLPPMTR